MAGQAVFGARTRFHHDVVGAGDRLGSAIAGKILGPTFLLHSS